MGRPPGNNQETSRTSLTGAILAGGRSRRLGQDKARLQLSGKPLTLWAAEPLQAVVEDLWLVTNTPLDHLDLGLPILSDLVPDQGPLGGVQTALFFSRTPWVLAASVDNPFLSAEALGPLAARASRTSRPAVVYRSERGLEPFPGLYHVRILARLTAYLHQRRHVQPFLEQLRPEVLPTGAGFDPESPGGWFFNLNTPEDVRRAEAWLAVYPRNA